MAVTWACNKDIEERTRCKKGKGDVGWKTCQKWSFQAILCMPTLHWKNSSRQYFRESEWASRREKQEENRHGEEKGRGYIVPRHVVFGGCVEIWLFCISVSTQYGVSTFPTTEIHPKETEKTNDVWNSAVAQKKASVLGPSWTALGSFGGLWVPVFPSFVSSDRLFACQPNCFQCFSVSQLVDMLTYFPPPVLFVCLASVTLCRCAAHPAVATVFDFSPWRDIPVANNLNVKYEFKRGEK